MVNRLALDGEAACLVGHEACALSCADYDRNPLNIYNHETSDGTIRRTFTAEVGLSAFTELAFFAL